MRFLGASGWNLRLRRLWPRLLGLWRCRTRLFGSGSFIGDCVEQHHRSFCRSSRSLPPCARLCADSKALTPPFPLRCRNSSASFVTRENPRMVLWIFLFRSNTRD